MLFAAIIDFCIIRWLSEIRKNSETAFDGGPESPEQTQTQVSRQ
jgi:hypothetical protein